MGLNVEVTPTGAFRVRGQMGNRFADSERIVYECDYEAIRAFEDERLGRWRHPDYPHIFAKKDSSDDWVGVVKDNEEGLAYGQFKRGVRGTTDPMAIVAAAYFAVHPGSKPWHDAKPGEVWLLTTKNVDDRWNPTAFCVAERDYDIVFRPTEPEYSVTYMGVGATAITNARRIYPEA